LSRFQSTHPMRDATVRAAAVDTSGHNFNPRIPCGMRLAGPLTRGGFRNFNPRIPCGMRLGTNKAERAALQISIHASHAGCDNTTFSVTPCC